MNSPRSDSGFSDDSMEHPPLMKATKRRLEEVDEMLADVSHLREEFTELYEKDYPQLQRCIDKLHHIIRTFEEDFRRATKGARDGGAVAIAGGAVAGLAGVALASVTLGPSLAVAGAGAAATVCVIYGGFKHAKKKRKMTELRGNKSAKKKRKMTELREDDKAEQKDFQNKLNSMSEKMKGINERIEQILNDLDKLERDARDVSEYFASTSERRNIQREEMTAMNAQMSGVKRLIGTITGFFSAVRLLLDSLSVIENTRELNEIDKLAETPINKDRDEREMETKAGKFIDGMRNVMNQLEDITEEIKKTKDKMAK